MSGTLVITNPPSFSICSRGVWNESVGHVFGIDAVARIRVASNYLRWPPRCVWAQFGICFLRLSRDEE